MGGKNWGVEYLYMDQEIKRRLVGYNPWSCKSWTRLSDYTTTTKWLPHLCSSSDPLGVYSPGSCRAEFGVFKENLLKQRNRGHVMDQFLWVRSLHLFTKQEDKWDSSAALSSRALTKPHVYLLWGKNQGREHELFIKMVRSNWDTELGYLALWAGAYCF